MAVAIVVLQTGERVITDLQEVREDNKEDGKPVCLMFLRPYNLDVESTNDAVVNQEVQVRFSKWVPYSADTQFKIPFSAVTAVGAPDPGLAQAYQQTVEQAIAAENATKNATQTAEQVPPPAAKTGVVPAGQGFAGEPVPPEEYQTDEQHDDHIPGYPEDGTLPDGSVDPDREMLDMTQDDKDTAT